MTKQEASNRLYCMLSQANLADREREITVYNFLPDYARLDAEALSMAIAALTPTPETAKVDPWTLLTEADAKACIDDDRR